MLIYPNHERTHQIMEGPWFFLGPILIWYLVSFSDISSLIDLFIDTMDPNLALQSLADLLGTKAGASAAWSHMVAGDIFVTRWIWKRCIESNCEKWKLLLSVFFGVMLMPIGLILSIILVRK
jgi:hypothetical protein|tara:strand:- start:168 stop:533 length:366 start_codon:yes stop_codon:yes gene_type:complete